MLSCLTHNPCGCAGSDSTSSLPHVFKCFIEQCSVWALEVKNKASMHSKPTTIGVSCLPPKSLSLSLRLSSFPLILCCDEPLQWEKDFDPVAWQQPAKFAVPTQKCTYSWLTAVETHLFVISDYCPQYLVEWTPNITREKRGFPFYP